MSKKRVEGELARVVEVVETVEPRERFRGVLDHLVRSDIVAAAVRGDSPMACEAREQVESEVEALRNEIAGKNPSVLEEILAEQIATCYAFVTMLDLQSISSLEKRSSKEASDFWASQSERATRRLTRSIGALVNVRRVQVAAIQVNIGEKQVNVGSIG